MLRCLLIGAAAALQFGSVSDEKLPAYLLNSQASFKAGKLFASDAAADVVSFFMGGGYDSSSEYGDSIVKHIPSPFLEDKHTAVVMVENLDENLSESKYGSPDFFLEKDALEPLGTKLVQSSVGKLRDTMAASSEMIVRVDAVQDGIDYNRRILDALDGLKDVRLMIIGVPAPKNERANVAASSFGNRDTAASSKNKSLSYIKIPSSFTTEDECLSYTKSCSGRGSCVKSSNGRYSCQCKSTSSDGYTYYWGGSDCSKRDVSTQFNLLVGTTLALVVAGALSVKLLFSLGSEPLPGVLNTTTL